MLNLFQHRKQTPYNRFRIITMLKQVQDDRYDREQPIKLLKTKKVPEPNPGLFHFNPTSNYFLSLVVVVEVALAFLLSLVQEPPFLQHFLSVVQVLVDVLLSLEADAACCPKAKPVIPTIATAKINFFIV